MWGLGHFPAFLCGKGTLVGVLPLILLPAPRTHTPRAYQAAAGHGHLPLQTPLPLIMAFGSICIDYLLQSLHALGKTTNLPKVCDNHPGSSGFFWPHVCPTPNFWLCLPIPGPLD